MGERGGVADTWWRNVKGKEIGSLQKDIERRAIKDDVYACGDRSYAGSGWRGWSSKRMERGKNV
jgi:hypothetical protein